MIHAAKFIFYLALLCILSITFACSPVHVVSTHQMPAIDYGSYQTFDFMDISLEDDSIIAGNSREIQLLKDAIAREMEARGYTRSDNPDLWVNIGIVVEQKIQTRETSFREAPIYIGQRNYHWESEEIVVDKYEQGTVTVDVIDAKEKERIWEGAAAGTLTDDLQKLEKRIDEAMELLFNEYPQGTM